MSVIFIGAYEVTRQYGGPEEGGWWYDWREHIESIGCKDSPEAREQAREELKKRHADKAWGKIWSVNGGVEVHYLTEEYPGDRETKSRPCYE